MPDKRDAKQPEGEDSEGFLATAHRFYDQASHLVEEKYDEMKRWLTSDEEDEVDDETPEEQQQREQRHVEGAPTQHERQERKAEHLERGPAKAEKEIDKSKPAVERQQEQEEILEQAGLEEKPLHVQQRERQQEQLQEEEQEQVPEQEERRQKQDEQPEEGKEIKTGKEESEAKKETASMEQQQVQDTSPPSSQQSPDTEQKEIKKKTAWHSEPERKAIEKQEDASAKFRSQRDVSKHGETMTAGEDEGKQYTAKQFEAAPQVGQQQQQQRQEQKSADVEEGPAQPKKDIVETSTRKQSRSKERSRLQAPKENDPTSTSDTYSQLTSRSPEKKKKDFDEKERQTSHKPHLSSRRAGDVQEGDKPPPAMDVHEELERNPAQRFGDIGQEVDENLEKAKKKTDKRTQDIQEKLNEQVRVAEGRRPEIAEDVYSRLTNRTKEQKRRDVAHGEQQQRHRRWRDQHTGGKGRRPKATMTPTATFVKSTEPAMSQHDEQEDEEVAHPKENDPDSTIDTYSHVTNRTKEEKQKAMGRKQAKEQRSQGRAEQVHPDTAPQAAQLPAKKHRHRHRHRRRGVKDQPLHHDETQDQTVQQEQDLGLEKEEPPYQEHPSQEPVKIKSQLDNTPPPVDSEKKSDFREAEQWKYTAPHHEHEWHAHGAARQSRKPDHVLTPEERQMEEGSSAVRRPTDVDIPTTLTTTTTPSTTALTSQFGPSNVDIDAGVGANKENVPSGQQTFSTPTEKETEQGGVVDWKTLATPSHNVSTPSVDVGDSSKQTATAFGQSGPQVPTTTEVDTLSSQPMSTTGTFVSDVENRDSKWQAGPELQFDRQEGQFDRPLQMDQQKKQFESTPVGNDTEQQQHGIERQLRVDQQRLLQNDPELKHKQQQHQEGDKTFSSDYYKQWTPTSQRPLQEQQYQLYQGGQQQQHQEGDKTFSSDDSKQSQRPLQEQQYQLYQGGQQQHQEGDKAFSSDVSKQSQRPLQEQQYQLYQGGQQQQGQSQQQQHQRHHHHHHHQQQQQQQQPTSDLYHEWSYPQVQRSSYPAPQPTQAETSTTTTTSTTTPHASENRTGQIGERLTQYDDNASRWVQTPQVAQQQQTKVSAQRAGESAREVEDEIKSSMRDDALENLRDEKRMERQARDEQLTKAQNYKRVSEHSWLVADTDTERH